MMIFSPLSFATMMKFTADLSLRKTQEASIPEFAKPSSKNWPYSSSPTAPRKPVDAPSLAAPVKKFAVTPPVKKF